MPENGWDIDMGYYYEGYGQMKHKLKELELIYSDYMRRLTGSMEMVGTLLMKMGNTSGNRIMMRKLEWVKSDYLRELREKFEVLSK